MTAREASGIAHGMSVAMPRGHAARLLLNGGIGAEDLEGARAAGAAPSVQQQCTGDWRFEDSALAFGFAFGDLLDAVDGVFPPFGHALAVFRRDEPQGAVDQ
jgi:hypothetical protein